MQSTQDQDGRATLAASLELASKAWKIAVQQPRRERAGVHTVAATGAADRLEQAIRVLDKARAAAGLGPEARVVVVYEAGQDGFWIARALRARGYEVVVIDPASIPVPRHARRAKTDRLDAIALLNALHAWLHGERERMHVIRIPQSQAEAHRHLVRERGLLQKEIGQHRDRMVKLLRTMGCWEPVDQGFGKLLQQGQLRCHDGGELPLQLRCRIARELARMEQAQAQLKELESTLVQQLPQQQLERIDQLTRLKAVGQVGATRLVLELFWRNFNNRRQVGSCLGLVSQPYDSGESRVDQGVSKRGNGRTRSLMIEMAWMWLRYQPQSELAQWFERRTAAGAAGKRGKRVAIVAVARRLAIALWRYLAQGVIPARAELKPAC